MLDDIKRFDMAAVPMRQHLLPLIWLLSMPAVISHKNKLTKINMENIKPPYLLLCNHNAFMDFKVATKAVFPHRANYVVAIDGFWKREWLLRLIGCICKRKFTNDIYLIRQLKRVTDRGNIAVIYPEARYSLCGTTAILPEATMKCLFTPEQLASLNNKEIMEGIRREFEYDDFKWQKEKGLHIKYNERAKGLHKVLYKCVACGVEYKMTSAGTVLRCNACGKEWQMTELGELEAMNGKTEFSHIPDWYEWERDEVRREVENGTYGITCEAQVDALPNAKRYIDIGKAKLTHDMSGFTLCGSYKGEAYTVKLEAASQYSVHIEYDYLGKKGDCVDLNTINDTLYVYPEGSDFSVTKMALATEELWKFYQTKA